jgi:peptide-N-glycosidase F-like protein/type IX secretion system substrate protein
MQKGLLILLFGCLLGSALMPAYGQGGDEYGIIPFTKLTPFTLPTKYDGDFVFSEEWTGDDSWLFVAYDNSNPYATALWSSIGPTLFQQLPQNVHIFFLSYSKTRPSADMLSAEQKMDAAMAGMNASSKAYWESRVHYVPTSISKLDNWISDVLANKPYSVFCIDRFQRLRETGLLRNITAQNSPTEIAWIAKEAEHFNYEYDRQQYLNSVEPLEITVIDRDSTKGNRFSGEIMLPDAATMAQFDKMEIDLTFGCRENSDDNCFEWDYLTYLYLCDDAIQSASTCKQEIGRWITSYHRQGRWITDYTPFLPLLKDGGRKYFRFQAQDKWIVTLKLRFINTGSSMRPMETVRFMADSLYGRSLIFNQNYNNWFPPVTFTQPEWSVKTEIAALISGHGFGADAANCAEFCNHQHWFDVNGLKTYKKEHPEAGTQYGCMFKIDEGVTPNQFGTWPYGRGGWCPGQDVPPFVADVSSSIVPGENTIQYRGLFNGKDYVPVPTSGTFKAQLRTAIWLVHWSSKPVGIERNKHVQPGFFTLQQNFPNPFVNSTVIQYDVRHSGTVNLTVYDAMGREVRTLVNEHKDQGIYKYRFESGNLNPGVYYYTLRGAGWNETKKMLVME